MYKHLFPADSALKVSLDSQLTLVSTKALFSHSFVKCHVNITHLRICAYV